jgi:hypothetical protein
MLRFASTPDGSGDSWLRQNSRVLEELGAANRRALQVERLCVPFSGTPEPERQILADLLQVPPEDKTKVAATLEALAAAIRFRQDTLEWLGRQSGRSLRLARWGWYATLGFSILSIILGLMSLGR